MTWQRREQRPIVDWPDGRDWRCPNPAVNIGALEVPCGFTEPEDARPTETACPDCGTQLVRTVVKL